MSGSKGGIFFRRVTVGLEGDNRLDRLAKTLGGYPRGDTWEVGAYRSPAINAAVFCCLG